MLPDITSQKVAIPAALFLALSPGVLLTTNGSKVTFMNRKTNQTAIFFHALVFFLVYSLIAKARQGDGSRAHQDRPRRDHRALPRVESWASPYSPPRVGWCCSLGTDQPRGLPDTRDCIRRGFRAFASSISSISRFGASFYGNLFPHRCPESAGISTHRCQGDFRLFRWCDLSTLFGGWNVY